VYFSVLVVFENYITLAMGLEGGGRACFAA